MRRNVRIVDAGSSGMVWKKRERFFAACIARAPTDIVNLKTEHELLVLTDD